MPGHGEVERFREQVQLGKRNRGLGHFLRKKPRQTAGDAGKLGVALGVVFFAVQLVQKKTGSGLLGFGVKKILVCTRKAPGLKLLDGAHRTRQPRRAGSACPQLFDLRDTVANKVAGIHRVLVYRDAKNHPALRRGGWGNQT